MLSLTKKNIQKRLKSLMEAPMKIKSLLKSSNPEEKEEAVNLQIYSKKIRKRRTLKLRLGIEDGASKKDRTRRISKQQELALKLQEDDQGHVPSYGNLKTPPQRFGIKEEESSTSNFMSMFTSSSSKKVSKIPIREKSIKIDSSQKKLKYPKPKLKFPIPDPEVLRRMILLQQKSILRPSLKKPPDVKKIKETPKEANISSIFKESKVSQLKLKLKTIKRIINNFESNITSICKKYAIVKDENGKTFKICKEKWKKLKVENRRNFVYISHIYEQVTGIPADVVAVCLLLFSAIRVGLTGSMFVKAARNLSKTRITNVKKLRSSDWYRVVKSVLKRE